MSRLSIETLESREVMSANPIATMDAFSVNQLDGCAGRFAEFDSTIGPHHDGGKFLIGSSGQDAIHMGDGNDGVQALRKLMARIGSSGQDGVDVDLDKLMARIGDSGRDGVRNALEKLMTRIGSSGQDGVDIDLDKLGLLIPAIQ